VLSAAAGAAAQDLNPRARAPMPTGGNIVMLSCGRSSGGVLFDPSLPVEDVHAVIHSGVLLQGRSLALLGRSANAVVALPYAWGDMARSRATFSRVTRSRAAWASARERKRKTPRG
jgi:hypothetical protein